MQRVQGSLKNKIIATDMLEERAKVAFDQQELQTYLYGGEENLNGLKALFNELERPELRNHHKFYEMTPEEQQHDLMKRVSFLWNDPALHKKYFTDYRPQDAPYHDWPFLFQGLLPGFGLQYSMFYISVNGLASEEQKKTWMPLIQEAKIMGCYAQTELGHGSNVAGIETTATLDKNTDEFIIHSPTITSTKFWPGDLGRHTSHAVVFARLLIEQNDYGVQPFLVQIRDPNNWHHLKGVKSGDLGPKQGYFSKDNGWATFDQVRIPRTNMLMGFCGVSKAGDFSVTGDLRVLYTVMMHIRMLIVRNAGEGLSQGALLGIRYGVMRRQFKTINGSKEERKIMDYQTHQHIFGPILAHSFVMHMNGSWVADQYTLMMEDVRNGKFDRMDNMHHILAGFKSVYSEEGLVKMEAARRACGGAGYSAHSAFTQILSNTNPIPTYEGDNIVMLGQASRYLFKMVQRSAKNQTIPFPFSYINNLDQLLNLKAKANSASDFLNLDVLEQALQVRASYLIKKTLAAMQASNQPDTVKENELFGQAKIAMTRAHFQAISLSLFRNQTENHVFKDSRIKVLLLELAKIYALSNLMEDPAPVYDSGFFGNDASLNMGEALAQLVAAMRPQLLPLIESFYQTDSQLPSAIGNSYGDIYEAQYEWARDSRLNKEEVVPYFEELMKPILNGGKL